MSGKPVSIVLVHGAWADGTSWAKVIQPLAKEGYGTVAAPLPLTSFADDVAALERTLERVSGPIVLAGHAYAGAVIAAAQSAKIIALVYVAALAPDEGETVADVFYRGRPHPEAPTLAPDRSRLDLSAARSRLHRVCSGSNGRRTGAAHRRATADLAGLHYGSGRSPGLEAGAGLVPGRRTGPHDHRRQSALHGETHAGTHSCPPGRSHPHGDGTGRGPRHHSRGDPRHRLGVKPSPELPRRTKPCANRR